MRSQRPNLQLPRDFGGEANFAVVAFQRRQQADIDSWKSVLDGLWDTHPGVRVYALATLPRSASWLRGFIDGGCVRPSRTPRRARGRSRGTSTKRPSNVQLGIASEATIAVLLIKRDGSVPWRTTGPYGPARPPDISAALGSLRRERGYVLGRNWLEQAGARFF